MRKHLFITSLIVLSLSCANAQKKDVKELIETEESELFNLFLENFSRIEEFQLSRIHFPLRDCDFNSDDYDNCLKIKKPEWVFLDLLPKLNPPISIIDIYDNFDLKVGNTGERVLAFEATETNVCIYYYFKLIEEKWYLIERRTCAD